MQTISRPQGTLLTSTFPGSKKIYIEADGLNGLKVPMRSIALSNNEPTFLTYDTTGPFTDEDVVCDVMSGLEPVREQSIAKRGDTEVGEGSDQ